MVKREEMYDDGDGINGSMNFASFSTFYFNEKDARKKIVEEERENAGKKLSFRISFSSCYQYGVKKLLASVPTAQRLFHNNVRPPPPPPPQPNFRQYLRWHKAFGKVFGHKK